ncbi:ATP-dependent DNA helicase DinG [Streptosporangium becharense]|uniref:ATP-dependent helicase DinG n=1 Tax=Streptosporangium becharense TaxID=1816182 RepID=A0A7W9MJC1_9ACTN|nr:ATP-dependent DNA helicase [Streptosporangium becharense]MBB2911661.1 ATP-dependent DNA helicase DinG [Streptosporangium becharense]MBB5822521.1 ATP-dependent DNA helicase DinG [Streptosporangium becharense]
MPTDSIASSHDVSPTVDIPPVEDLLSTAVQAVGGVERPGQITMARAVQRAIDSGEHLAVQAGTGTGKSLAYLIPSIRHAMTAGSAVVVSTATIALQRQLVDRDLPRLAGALAPKLPHEPTFAILKGRRNYLCRYKASAGWPDEEQDQLFDPRETSATGRMVQRIQEWADETETGDRDELVPGVNEQAWRQFSVSSRECLGATRCPNGTECFAELARARAGESDVVVTNHALLAIDAMEDLPLLPEHEVVVVDEAHELVDRVTSVVSGELSETMVSLAVRRVGKLIEQHLADRLLEAGEDLKALLAAAPAGRLDDLPQVLGLTLTLIRDSAWACVTALGPRNADKDDPEAAGLRKAAFTALDEVHDTAQRMLDAFGHASEIDRAEVVWLEAGTDRRPAVLRVAPLTVAGMLRDKLFGDRTVILTSATLALGGAFDGLARQWGLGAAGTNGTDDANVTDTPGETGDGEGRAGKPKKQGARSRTGWTGLDVGSPFDHPRSGILYIAKHLPQPGRDGLPEAYLEEITELIEAAGGRTLGLFSSMRAARAATDALRDRLSVPLLCQGDDSTMLLVKQFAEDEPTCLFGTLSLWQGVDVPGPSLRLVIIDRIPFPRPDDPLSSARQRHVTAKGGNGFMAVAATHAALLLAQGAGRLLRSQHDKGVVAVLDPRLATARYAGFLRDSLPPFWPTHDPAKVRSALRRLGDG